MGTPRTEKVGKDAARRYLAKGREFAEVADRALSDQHYNGAGLAAVHAGISLGDAVLGSVAGLRCTERDHGAILALLEQHVAAFTATRRRQLASLLRLKNTVEYDQHPLNAAEATAAVENARRLAAWAVEVCAPVSRS